MTGCPSPLQAEQAWVPGSWRGLASQSAPRPHGPGVPGTLQESTISRPGGTPAPKPKPTGSLRAGGALRRPLVSVAPQEAGARSRFHPPSIAFTPLLWMTAPLSRGMLQALGCAHGGWLQGRCSDAQALGVSSAHCTPMDSLGRAFP